MKKYIVILAIGLPAIFLTHKCNQSDPDHDKAPWIIIIRQP